MPTRVLLHQWHRELTRHSTARVGMLGDGVRRVEPITVSTFASAERLLASVGDRFELLVVDEAHHACSGTTADLLDLACASRRLGLTATPPRDPEPGATGRRHRTDLL